MKKIISIITMIIVMMFSMGAYAAPKKTNEVKFYVQINGVQMDKVGDISGRAVTNFTDCVYTTTLKHANIKNLVLGNKVTENTILLQFKNRPNTDNVLKNVKNTYMYKGYIKDNTGKVVSWNKMNSDNYRLQWYVLKVEDDGWHCDGRVIDLATEQGIQVVIPKDTKEIPKEAYEEETPQVTPTVTPQVERVKYRNDYAYIYGYNDNTMAAEEPLLRCEISQMIYRLVKQNNDLNGYVFDKQSASVFTDVSNAWFRSGIEYIAYKNGFDVQKGTNVYPMQKLTRGETFKLICLGLNFTDNCTLSDEQYTEILANSNIVIGDEKGNYNIDKYVTRAEFVTMFNRLLGRDRYGLYTVDGMVIAADTYGFKDLKENQWYYEDMLKATSAYSGKYVDLELRGARNNLDDYE